MLFYGICHIIDVGFSATYCPGMVDQAFVVDFVLVVCLEIFSKQCLCGLFLEPAGKKSLYKIICSRVDKPWACEVYIPDANWYKSHVFKVRMPPADQRHQKTKTWNNVHNQISSQCSGCGHTVVEIAWNLKTVLSTDNGNSLFPCPPVCWGLQGSSWCNCHHPPTSVWERTAQNLYPCWLDMLLYPPPAMECRIRSTCVERQTDANIWMFFRNQFTSLSGHRRWMERSAL